MTVRSWPDWLEDLWAKSPHRADAAAGESLAQHTWNVLEMLSQSMRLRPDLPATVGFPSLWTCLFWACFLHDFGKAARGFQDTLRGGPRWHHRHEVLSLAFLDWVAVGLSEEERRWTAAAIASHHRDPNEILLSYNSLGDEEDDPVAALICEVSPDTVFGLWRWVEECSSSWISTLGFDAVGVGPPHPAADTDAIQRVRNSGAARIRYWLQTYSRWLRTMKRSQERSLSVGTLALRGHVISADHMASAHTGDLPACSLGGPTELLQRLGMERDGLYLHQRLCAGTQGSALLVAPTGSGKTEAALLWTTAQSSPSRPVPRLFYTLPYQASMNAMYDRLTKAFPKQIGLEHSRSALALYRRALEGHHTPEQAAGSAKWARNLAQLSYFPVRVLSPYQILKGPYRLKGYESLMSDFFDGAFVMDEIHAYEADRLAIILATVRYLRQHFNCRFFVMTATLPRLVESRLAEALGVHADIKADQSLFAVFRRHLLHLLDGDLLEDRWLARIAEAALDGQLVLVCCNTVRRAQQAHKELGQRLGGQCDTILLHGRFNGRDRLSKEQAIQSVCGAHSADRRPIVVVATQVVEVSLDIDLDVIYTDPAPLEALIQRFGRVNRRRLRKQAPVFVFTKPDDGQKIYQEDLVRASLAVLEKNAEEMIDEQAIAGWLDGVYRDAISVRWNREYEQARDDFEAACLSTLRAFESDDILEKAFYSAFDSVEVLPAAMQTEYLTLLTGEPLKASELLVPMQWGQYARLLAKGKASHDQGNLPRTVDLRYDRDSGLQLE
ncbi:MAG: CRISPR-associated helicase Cas3' [Chloroflexi bacterium]|nr:CRISPR-associated helicase Cas3' [Chloroflexota bacterium]